MKELDCANCNDAPFATAKTCTDCKEAVYRSKIKKVVIPETKVKYVCEFSEAEFLDEISSDAFAAHKRIEIDPSEDCQRIETPKPLADDEVSVEDCSRSDNNYYVAVSSDSSLIFLVGHEASLHSFYWQDFRGVKQFITNTGIFTEFIKQQINRNFTILQIDDQETLFQWCLDKVRRAKGEN